MQVRSRKTAIPIPILAADESDGVDGLGVAVEAVMGGFVVVTKVWVTEAEKIVTTAEVEYMLEAVVGAADVVDIGMLGSGAEVDTGRTDVRMVVFVV